MKTTLLFFVGLIALITLAVLDTAWLQTVGGKETVCWLAYIGQLGGIAWLAYWVNTRLFDTM